jgi:hypothetical protein
MQFLLLIYYQEANFANMSEQDREAIYKEYVKVVQELKAKNQYLGGHPLRMTSEASTVRLRDRQKVVTDGPFAETKEQLGGYFLVETQDVEEAREIAARIPAARNGSIEVRPVIVQGQAKTA